MGLLSRLRLTRRKQRQSPTAALESAELFSWAPGAQPWLPGGTYVGVASWWNGRVSRADALSVPPVLRGRNMICSIAALPLNLLDAGQNIVSSTLLRQIDPSVPNVVTLTQTIEDLVFEGVSWWQVTAYDWEGRPAHARHVDSAAVSVNPPPGFSISTLPSGIFPDGVVYVMGSPVDARLMLRFDSPNPPVCTAGARAIRRALKLAQAGEMYADDPEARAYWRPLADTDPGDEGKIKGYIQRFIEARRRGSEAYVGAPVERVPISVATPADLQLTQLQQRSDLEIADVMGLDPEDLGVNTTSRTYNNAVDRRVDKVNETLGVYMRAITDRLSMDDVTRRGYRTAFDLSRYMQADPATRWNTYGIAIDKKILSVPEIRTKEGYPEVPVAAPAPTQGAPVQTQNTTMIPVRFSTGDDRGEWFTFDQPAEFSVDSAKRTISGDILPYNVVGENYSGKWRFEPGSVEWNRSAVSRVKLNDEHYGPAFGAATVIKSSDTGVSGTFKVGRGAVGDAQLMSAEDGIKDGLSAEVKILEYTIDKTGDAPVNVVTKARLTGAAQTANPAFDDARVTKVAASRSGGTMNCTTCGQEHAAGTPCPVTPPAPTPAVDLSTFTRAVDSFTAAVEALTGTIPAEQRPAVPAGRVEVREPLVYSLNGFGPSFVRDAWEARNLKYGSKVADEALARLRKYGEQTQAFAAAAVQRFANAGNTTDQAQLIPPGYRPDLYVGQIPQGRPLYDSIGTRVGLADATPFKVPVWVGSSGLSGTNSEGTGPSTGTITDHTYETVTPTAQSGEFVVTRELMDSSNPAIDVIAMNAMREEYSQDTEAIIAAAIAAATDDGSPVDGTPDQSTEGCWVYTLTGTGNDLATNGIREMEADFVTHRFLAPDRMLGSPTGFKAMTKATDDIGRSLFPFIGAQNAQGTVGRAGQSLNVDGLMVPNAWSMTSTYDDVLLFNSVDMLVGESPMLTFRFEEKSGPENIVLNIWAYFAFQILRYPGIHALNYTAA